MAEPRLSILTRLTEFFATAHIEACARRTGFVQRASKITGKVFLALVTLGQWSVPKTSLAQLAAKAAQLAEPVAVSPEALHQRMNPRALAFLRELIQTAFAKFHTPDTVCDAALFTPFPQVYIADSTGFSLPASLREAFPGTGGSASPAGVKLQLVWDYKSSTFAHFALGPGNLPDSKYVDTVVSLAGKGASVLFDLGYFKSLPRSLPLPPHRPIFSVGSTIRPRCWKRWRMVSVQLIWCAACRPSTARFWRNPCS